MRRCLKCVTYLKETDRACPACGTPVPGPPRPDQVSANPPEEPAPAKISLWPRRGFPEFQRQWQRKVVEHSAEFGFLVGLLLIFAFFLGLRETRTGDWCMVLIAPLLLAGGFSVAAVVGVALIEGICESLGWDKKPNLPPGSTLTRTDSLVPQEGETGILDPSSAPSPLATDRESVTQREDIQPPG
jgi:hypothetical protein